MKRAHSRARRWRPARPVTVRTRTDPARALRCIAFAAGIALCTFAPPEAAEAQESFDRRLVTSLEFNGVVEGDERELRATIRTSARRCKSFLFQPLCWITSSGIFEEKPRLDALELQRDELRIRVYYWRAGYRSARAAARVESDGDDVKVAFDVDEGPATVIETLDLVQTDSVLSARQLRRARAPRPGVPLDIGEIDSTRIRIESMLWDIGYADAAVRDSVVLADTSARVTLQIEPGARTTVGNLAITGNEQVSERTIRRLVDLPPGHTSSGVAT